MDVSEIIIPGDTPGTEWRLPVLRFTGGDPKAPKTYIQAALHAGELPGTVLYKPVDLDILTREINTRLGR